MISSVSIASFRLRHTSCLTRTQRHVSERVGHATPQHLNANLTGLEFRLEVTAQARIMILLCCQVAGGWWTGLGWATPQGWGHPRSLAGKHVNIGWMNGDRYETVLDRARELAMQEHRARVEENWMLPDEITIGQWVACQHRAGEELQPTG